jgi:hypothetical protein
MTSSKPDIHRDLIRCLTAFFQANAEIIPQTGHDELHIHTLLYAVMIQCYIRYRIKIDLSTKLAYAYIQGDSKRWTQIRKSIFSELYMVCE